MTELFPHSVNTRFCSSSGKAASVVVTPFGTKIDHRSDQDRELLPRTGAAAIVPGLRAFSALSMITSGR